MCRSANYKSWSGREVFQLLGYAETHTAVQAAAKLGRSVSSVVNKLNKLGYSWRRKDVATISDIAKQLGCTGRAVSEVCMSLHIPFTGDLHHGKRYQITPDLVDRVAKVTSGRLKNNRQKQRAGAIGQAFRRLPMRTKSSIQGRILFALKNQTGLRLSSADVKEFLSLLMTTNHLLPASLEELARSIHKEEKRNG